MLLLLLLLTTQVITPASSYHTNPSQFPADLYPIRGFKDMPPEPWWGVEILADAVADWV
ncbi:hypothetical protein ABZP36_021576 [Zizania latifolia]